MNPVLRYLAIPMAVVALAGCSTMGGTNQSQMSNQKQAQLASKAATVLQNQKMMPDKKQIPKGLVANARCIAVFPSVIKAGFIVGGDHGKGLVSCRQSSGGWSKAAPVVYSVSGGSIGLQAGAQESSVVLLFETKDSVNTLLHNKFKLGANAGVTAGPVGLNTHLSGSSPAPILAYATNKQGLFAGVSLNGNMMSFDQSANASLYGADADQHSLLLSSHTVPAAMQTFNSALKEFTSGAEE